MNNLVAPADRSVAVSPIKSKPHVKPKLDPFRYGWRIRPRVTPEGKVEYERIPLTSVDILHPEEEDFRVHSDEHMRFCNYLVNVFSSQVAHDPHAVVLHDTRVAWDVPDLGAHGPDVAVIFGVAERKKWGTFDVGEEGTRPDLIVEVTSPETRRLDLEDKVDEYALAGVPYFIIVDTHKTARHPDYKLLGYQLTPDGYMDLPTDAQGWIWLETVGVWIGLDENVLTCYDENGVKIEDYPEVAAAYREAAARAEEAERRLECENEARRAAEDRAIAEAQARAEAEARLQAMEEEMRRLRGDTD